MSAVFLERLAAEISVSRETMSRLEVYVALLRKWNEKINLVGPATLAEVWQRHIFDSLQLLPHVTTVSGNGRIADLGSGAGLPGLILAIAGAGPVTLIESDLRKGAFLREAARATGTSLTLLSQRIEKVSLEKVGIVTARALAPVSALLHYALPLLDFNGRCVFLKGAKAAEELEEAKRDGWHFACRTEASRSDPNGVILVLETISRDSAH